MKFRPLHDYLVVRLDPLPEKRGSIVLPDDRPGERVRTATVVRVGPGTYHGKRRQHVDVEPGEKVAFLRWHLEHKTGKTTTGFLAKMEEGLGIIRVPDVLFAFHADEKVDVS